MPRAEGVRLRTPPKLPVDPWQPIDVLVEEERAAGGSSRTCVTVFLAGAECPFRCVHCDLWRFTLDGPTPAGAVPAQLERALASLEGNARPEAIKLYNASNFFDARAVPTADLPSIASLLSGFSQVTVECHPRLVGDTAVQFAAALPGRLEIAMGLETIHPGALAKLDKSMTVEQFDRAVGFLRDHGIGTRAFVLLGPPFVPPDEAVEWAVRSVQHAVECGVDVVSVIPMRGATGPLDDLAQRGMLHLPTLEMFEQAMRACMGLGTGVVLADLWDVASMAGCDACRVRRIECLHAMNSSGRAGPVVTCGRCGESREEEV